MRHFIFLLTILSFSVNSLSQDSKADSFDLKTDLKVNTDALYSLERDTSMNVVRIGILAPFDYNYAAWKIYGLINAKNAEEASTIKLKESITEALDFYEGFKWAIRKNPPSFQTEIYTFDCTTNDSVFAELLKNDTLKKCDIIIGPGTATQAKVLAEFCKKYKIINLEAFVSAKNITLYNPYLIRLKPTIDGHLRTMFNYIADTLENANVIIYTAKAERNISAAITLDTLFKEYNANHDKKIRYTIVNYQDSTIPAKERTIGSHLSAGKNVIISTGFDVRGGESFLCSNARGGNLLFGMPTWMEADLKAECINNTNFHFSRQVHADTSNSQIRDFFWEYNANHFHRPTDDCIFGYDAANYIMLMLSRYGKRFAEATVQEPYQGIGTNFVFYKYMRKPKNSDKAIVNYYSNEAAHLFTVENYKIQFVY